MAQNRNADRCVYVLAVCIIVPATAYEKLSRHYNRVICGTRFKWPENIKLFFLHSFDRATWNIN
jgi:hypothetical protein